MKLVNPWKFLFRPSRPRLRRRPHDFGAIPSLMAEVLEVRRLLSSAAPQVSLTTVATAAGIDVTLASTDIDNPNVTVSRSGNFVVFAGTNGTQITYTNNGSTGTTQTLAIPTVSNLTVNLGTGIDSFTISGLNVVGNIAINGKKSGNADVAIFAAASNVTVGGSILANFGSEAVAFSVFGSFNPGSGGGGNMTVNGNVTVNEAGAGNKQVNLFGPPANNASGGKLAIRGGVSVVDTGSGQSGLRIDDGVTIGGNVSFDNSANTVNADTVQIFSNSNQFGTTSIGGTLSLALSNSTYNGDTVVMQGFGSLLPVAGAVTIDSNGGGDTIRLLNTWFKNAVTVDGDFNPSFSHDTVIVQGSRFDGAAQVILNGPYAELGLGTDSNFAPTVFNNTFTASMTGSSAKIFLSNPISGSNEVIFNATVHLVGHAPPDVGRLIVQGRFFVGAGKLTLTNFSTAAPPAVTPQVTLTTAATSSGTDVTLTSTDINNPNVTVSRSGNFVVFAGTNGTQITYTNN
ncbi:MAG: hypothetical protein ACM3U2_21785, partial [Deltaproteobacteria bacterium]